MQHGLPLYHVERTVEETGEKFGDGSHILYVNGECVDDTALGKLMHDFHCVNPDDMAYPVLREKAQYLKKDQKGVMHMSKIMDEIRAYAYEEAWADAAEQIREAEKAQAAAAEQIREAEKAQAAAEVKAREEIEKAQAEKEKAREQAEAEKSLIKKVLRMLRDGLPVDKIAEYTDMPLEEIKEFAALTV